MIYKTGRYSGFLRPISYGIDLGIIHLFAAPFFADSLVLLNYILFVSFAWMATAFRSNFYEIYRFTRTTNILSLGLKQGALFVLLVFAFFGFYRDITVTPWEILWYTAKVMTAITLSKIGIYYLLKKYRVLLKGNLPSARSLLNAMYSFGLPSSSSVSTTAGSRCSSCFNRVF